MRWQSCGALLGRLRTYPHHRLLRSNVKCARAFSRVTRCVCKPKNGLRTRKRNARTGGNHHIASSATAGEGFYRSTPRPCTPHIDDEPRSSRPNASTHTWQRHRGRRRRTCTASLRVGNSTWAQSPFGEATPMASAERVQVMRICRSRAMEHAATWGQM